MIVVHLLLIEAGQRPYRYSRSAAFAYPSAKMELAGGMGKDPDDDPSKEWDAVWWALSATALCALVGLCLRA